MKIVNLSKEEFDTFSQNHPLTSFEQTSAWGELKEEMGWRLLMIGGVDDSNKLKAAALILGKRLPLFNKYLYYCPHGYLVDFKNHSLWLDFDMALSAYLKKQQAFTFILDPYLPYRLRDSEGKPIDQNCEQASVDYFKELGYKHSGFNLNYENLQPRWHFRLPLDKTYEELVKGFSSQAKRKIRHQEKLAISVVELNEKEIPIFKKLMASTAKRRGFNDRSLSYYQKMYKHLNGIGILHYFGALIDFKKCANNIKKIIENKTIKLLSLKERANINTNLIKEEENAIHKEEKLLATVLKAQKELGDKPILSVICLLTYGKEAIMLLAANNDEYMQTFNTSYIISSELIKWSVLHNYAYYNFYGICGDFNPNNPGYGLYNFKKQYGGEVVEYIGQFEKIYNKPIYLIYKLGLSIYKLRRKFLK